jgi:hypothetical protein
MRPTSQACSAACGGGGLKDRGARTGDAAAEPFGDRDPAKCSRKWSEWQDLNLRPPRPERGALPEKSAFIGHLDDVQRRLFTFGCLISVAFLSRGATLDIAQGRGMTDQARICLVFEEAHSIVPEWNSVASEGDRTATATTARAILQGRKYGLGCLLITQRTANVTKTILNQCNTIFAMRTFDDTGKEFLSNYIGGEYADVLPSLEARHAVVFGKASSCENPVLIRLNNRDQFTGAFRQDNVPRPLPAIAPIPGDAN